MKTLVRVHVMLPREVLDEIDRTIEDGSRSQWVLKAIEWQLSEVAPELCPVDWDTTLPPDQISPLGPLAELY